MSHANSRSESGGRNPWRWTGIGLLRGLVNRLFGYDYFIAYAWEDGREYAVRLHEILEKEGFVCFLDSVSYAKGKNWRLAGRIALANTGRLIVVGTSGAVKSEAVQSEVEYFRERGRDIIPIDVEKGLANELSSPLMQMIGAERLRISEPGMALSSGPSTEVINELKNTFNLTRQYVKRLRWLTAAVFVLALACVAATLFGVLAYFQYRTAEARRLEAERKTRLATAQRSAGWCVSSRLEGYPQRSLLLGVEALRVTMRAKEPRVPVAEQALRDALALPGGRGLFAGESWADPQLTPERPWWSVAFSPDGQWLATGTLYGTARLWNLKEADPAAKPILLEGHVGGVTAVSFSSDGRWLATGSANGTTYLWDFSRPISTTGPIPLTGHFGGVAHLAFSRDGRRLVTAGRMGDTAYLWNLKASDPARFVRLSGHKGAVKALAFSPSGRWLATVGSEETGSRLYDLEADDPAVPRMLPGRQGVVAALSFSPDGRWLATGSDGSVARLWDLNAPNPARRPTLIEGHETQVERLSFSLNSLWLASAGGQDKLVRLWDLRRGKHRGPLDLQGQVTALELSPDGHWLFTGCFDKPARLWDLTAADPAKEPTALPDNTVRTTRASFSPDGRWLATASGVDSIARLWDLKATDFADSPLTLRGHEGAVEPLAFSPDGRWLVTAGERDPTARLWDLTWPDPAAPANTLKGHTGAISTLAFSANGAWLITAGDDTTVRLWDPRGAGPVRKVVALAEHPEKPLVVSLSPDGRWLATGGEDKTARLWSLQGPHPAAKPVALHTHASRVNRLVFDPRGRWLVTAGQDDTAASLWDLTEPKNKPAALAGHKAGPLGGIGPLAFSSDGRWLASAGKEDKTVRLWDLKRQNPAARPLVLAGHSDVVVALAFSPEGRRLATGSADKTARLWNLAAADPAATQVLLTGHADWVNRLAFSPDGRWFATASGGEPVARLWDLRALRRSAEAQPLPGHPNGVQTLSFSPDSHWLVTTPMTGAKVFLWDLKEDTVAKSLSLIGHAGWIDQQAFSPDGRWLATAGRAQSHRVQEVVVQLWDLKAADPADPSITLRPEANVTALAFSPNCRWLAVGDIRGCARLWPLHLEELIAQAGMIAGRNLSQEEWRRYFPGDVYRPTFPGLPCPTYDETFQEIARNLTRKEWQSYFHDLPYRKTFPSLPIPADPD